MTILVTVGTTTFDELIAAVDGGAHAADAHLQIAGGAYCPRHARWDRYIDGIESAYAAAELVVCHAGAGSVFGLLQAGLQPVVVPNLIRRDTHQAELGRWLERERYATVVWDLARLDATIDSVLHAPSVADEPLRVFEVDRFFYAAELNAQLRDAIGRL